MSSIDNSDERVDEIIRKLYESREKRAEEQASSAAESPAGTGAPRIFKAGSSRPVHEEPAEKAESEKAQKPKTVFGKSEGKKSPDDRIERALKAAREAEKRAAEKRKAEKEEALKEEKLRAAGRAAANRPIEASDDADSWLNDIDASAVSRAEEEKKAEQKAEEKAEQQAGEKAGEPKENPEEAPAESAATEEAAEEPAAEAEEKVPEAKKPAQEDTVKLRKERFMKSLAEIDASFERDETPAEAPREAAAAVPKAAGSTADPFQSDRFSFEDSRPDVREDDAGRYETRSILKALSVDEGPEDYGEINKTMLTPSMERATEAFDKVEEDTEAGNIPEEVPEERDLSGHPIFKTEYKPEEIVPEESEEQKSELQAPEADKEHPLEQLDSKAAEVAADGVLNVEANAEDQSFKKFFGNTVIMDTAPIRERLRKAQNRKRREEPEKKEEESQEESQQPGIQSSDEFRSPSQTEHFAEIYDREVSTCTFRTVISFIISAVLIYLNLTAEYTRFLAESFSSNPRIFAAVNAVLMLVCIAFNYRSVFSGFSKLVSFKANADSVTSFAAIISFAEALVDVIGTRDAVRPYTACVASLALAFSALGDQLTAKRNRSNFTAISGQFEKYATAPMDDEQFTRRITREFRTHDNKVLLKRKTGFTDGFVEYSRSSDIENSKMSLPTSIVFIIAVLCGVIQIIRQQSVSDVFATMAAAAALSSPFTATLASAHPMYRMQQKLSKLGTTVPGYKAVDEITDSNCVLLEARELFPKGNVMLHGIKTFEKERIDKAILYAASVLINSCDTLSNVFMNVIQGKTEMLYNVDSVVYEDGLGFSFWVDKNRVLLGSRQLLENHDIEIPSRDYENRYTKKSTRDAIYLAVSGRLYAMFVVSYRPNAEVQRALNGFAKEGINIVVRSRDFNVTADRISKMYNIPRSTITVVSESDMIELGEKTNFIAHTKSALTHIGTMSSYVNGIIGCYNVKQGLRFATLLELVCMIFGSVLGIALTLWGTLIGSGVMRILLFQLCWLCVSVLATVIRRYKLY
ncbi:MAG: hypothetical protein ACOX6J_02100 [Oscillospiraceae bacterium]|jgi:cation transport ATPase